MHGSIHSGHSRPVNRLLSYRIHLLVAESTDKLDADEIVYFLRQKYPEYSRKKKMVLLRMVKNTLNTLYVSETPDEKVSIDKPQELENHSKLIGQKRKYSEREASVKDELDTDDVIICNDVTAESNPRNGKKIIPITVQNARNTAEPISRNSVREGNNRSNKIVLDLYNAEKNGKLNNNQGPTNFPRKKRSVATEPEDLNNALNIVPRRSLVKMRDLAGCEQQFYEVAHLVMHIMRPEVSKLFEIDGKRTQPNGLLLHGPPGCGKTLFAEAIAGELDLPLIELAATELVTGVSGHSEELIRSLFKKAVEIAPCILLIDQIDAIAPNREDTNKLMGRRIVSQLIACLDDLSKPTMKEFSVSSVEDSGGFICKQGKIFVVGTTNRPDSIDPSLRRANRFDKEIALGIPTLEARLKILEIVCRGLRLHSDVNLKQIAKLTPGYVGADLNALAREASIYAASRIFAAVTETKSDTSREDSKKSLEEVQRIYDWLKSDKPIDQIESADLYVNHEDFEKARAFIHPSALREGFATVPNVTWDDIGALNEIREELNWSILKPIKNQKQFESYGMDRAQGILLCGPPGCGKTLLAKAIANETGLNFISVKGPELLNMYLGESERAIRTVFQRARDSSPCVIFFDEIDALCPKRKGTDSSGSTRIVNQLLTEMDGMDCRKQVFLMAATNRPDIIDPAVLRPGRLDKVLFVDFPDISGRADILRKATRNGTRPPIATNVSFDEIASNESLKYYTGADIVALVREATINVLKDKFSRDDDKVNCLTMEHFLEAMRKIKPSVSQKEREKYKQIKLLFKRGRLGNETDAADGS